jgi:hypothetical protein
MEGSAAYWEGPDYQVVVKDGIPIYIGANDYHIDFREVVRTRYQERSQVSPALPVPVKKFPLAYLANLAMTRADLREHFSLFSIRDQADLDGDLSNRRGLELSHYERRAAQAVAYLFADSKAGGIVLKPHELFSLAGAAERSSPGGKGKYHRQERKRFVEALEGLGLRHFGFVYTMPNSDKKVARIDHLFEIKEILYQKNKRGGKHIRLAWVITRGPLFNLWAYKYYRLLPPPRVFQDEIREHSLRLPPAKRKSAAFSRTLYVFLEWLHTHPIGHTEVRRNWLRLAQEIGLERDVEKRMTTKLRRTLDDLYRAAEELGYLTGYKVNQPSRHTDDGTVDILYLNPEKFAHLAPRRQA